MNVDFADVCAIMANAGSSFMEIGTGTGKTRARDAALNAIQSLLLDLGIERAPGIVWNITGGSDLTLFEVNAAAEVTYDLVDPSANLIFEAIIPMCPKFILGAAVLYDAEAFDSWMLTRTFRTRIIYASFHAHEERFLSSHKIVIALENFVWNPGVCVISDFILEDKDVLKRKEIRVRLALKQDEWLNGAAAHYNAYDWEFPFLLYIASSKFSLTGPFVTFVWFFLTYYKVMVTVEDGRSFIANAAIVIVPLGILKANKIELASMVALLLCSILYTNSAMKNRQGTKFDCFYSESGCKENECIFSCKVLNYTDGFCYRIPPIAQLRCCCAQSSVDMQYWISCFGGTSQDAMTDSIPSCSANSKDCPDAKKCCS